jgi:hypothetical protein
MTQNYIKKILKIFPGIASGRKNFKYFENRIKKTLILSHKYRAKKQIFRQK